MKLRLLKIDLVIGYEAVAAMTAVLLLDRENRVIGCFLAALLHESGHIFMMVLYGVKVRRVKLRLFDVLIEADEPPTLRSDVKLYESDPLEWILATEKIQEEVHDTLEKEIQQ